MKTIFAILFTAFSVSAQAYSVTEKAHPVLLHNNLDLDVNCLLCQYKGKSIQIEVDSTRFDLVAYTLVSETGHPSKILVLGNYPTPEACRDAAEKITGALSGALKPVGVFCIERLN